MRSSRAGAVLRLLRPHHWTKNLLVFVPMILAHRIGDTTRLADATLCFVAFCAAASAGYVVNDVADAGHDERHQSRRDRPIASGQLSRAAALLIVPLLVIAIACAMPLGGVTTIAVLIYWSFSAFYTLVLKKLVIADVIGLSAMYLMRIIAGGLATHIVVSQWLLAFSSFLFLSLAIAKRTSDLQRAAARNEGALAGRVYALGDIRVLQPLGIASGSISVLVFALYLHSPDVTLLYRNSRPLWIICALLMYWLARMWLLAERGVLHDDPIVAAAKDAVSYVVAIAAGAILILAT